MKILVLAVATLTLAGMAYGSGQIDIAYSPYTISQPGSYIVVKDLHTPQDKTCITINADNVTIDLNGHTLYGAGTTVGSLGNGIYSYGYSNIFLMNGTVRDFRYAGINIDNGSNVQATKIKSFGNKSYGIYAGTDNSKIWDNVVYNNGDDGMYLGNACEASGNSVSNNGSYGIYAAYCSRICNNSASGNVSTGIGVGSKCVVTNNCCYGNKGYGLSAGSGSIITNNTVSLNSTYGIYAADGNSVIGNAVYNNGTYGIYAYDGCNVKDNTIRNVSGDGIYVFNRCQVIGNNISNDSTGIEVSSTGDANLIAQNNITGCSNYGILCNGTGINYLNSNVLRFNITPSNISGSNKVGSGDLANVSY